MSTVTVAAPAGRRPVLRRILSSVLLLLLIAILGLLGWLYVVNRRALPQVDGSATLPGLSAPATVIRDARGVPTIRAASVTDAVVAQGYVTAQDRLWEMDVLRRDGGGELAEILGLSALKRDEQQHTLGTQQIAQRALAAMPPDNRAFLEAYARGVNAFIDSHPNSLPLEFRLLGYRPRPWRAEDSLLIGISMGEMLNFGYIRDMLAREKVTAKVGPQLAADLYPVTSWRDIPPSASAPPLKELPKPPPIPETRLPQENVRRSGGEGRASAVPFDSRTTAALAAEGGFCGILCDGDDLRAGSNDWVVSGALTASGRPMLSNDMHLPHQIPNIWYEAHLTAGDFDVAGVSLPGVPFIIVGHNRRIAWGFTNINPQVTDLYIENFNDKGEYQTPGGWKLPEHRRETIRVKGRPDEVLDVVSTRHGPIISAQLPGETRQVALQATMFDPAALQFPFSMVDAAQNWDEFRAAFSHFGLPGQNVVYADVDGHIGYQATGFVPIRKTTSGGIPVPGNDDAHEWTGYIPFDQMPRV
ncbi:MAG TPA: penicillin acylase family protein, partial [Terriglobales bacterium]|nr:penicillin acylase family protein [Terriglobales bacterium]